MTYELITERNVSAGLQVLFVYINDISHGLFINMFLAMIFLAVTFGIYLTAKRTSLSPDLPGALAAGSFVTALICVLMNLIEGLVSTFTNVVVMTALFVFVMLFLFSRER